MALGWSCLRQKREEREGYKRLVVAWALPSAVVRIEEGRPSGADGRAPVRGNGTDGRVPRVREGGKGRMRVGWSWAAACWAGPVGLARPAFSFFYNKTLFYFLFSKTKTKPNQNFSEKFDKILFEKLVKFRTLWHKASQQNKIK